MTAPAYPDFHHRGRTYWRVTAAGRTEVENFGRGRWRVLFLPSDSGRHVAIRWFGRWREAMDAAYGAAGWVRAPRALYRYSPLFGMYRLTGDGARVAVQAAYDGGARVTVSRAGADGIYRATATHRFASVDPWSLDFPTASGAQNVRGVSR